MRNESAGGILKQEIESSTRISSASHSIALGILLTTASLILVKTGRDALYVQDRGIIDLQIAYLGMAVFSLPTAFRMLALIRVMGPRRSRIVALLASSALLAICWQVARPGSGLRMTAIFIGVPLIFGVLFSRPGYSLQNSIRVCRMNWSPAPTLGSEQDQSLEAYSAGCVRACSRPS